MSFGFLLLSCVNEEMHIAFKADSEVTWYKDVQPIVEKHCVRCHNEDGIAVGNFRDIDDVITLAPLMHAAMSDGRMPPPSSEAIWAWQHHLLKRRSNG